MNCFLIQRATGALVTISLCAVVTLPTLVQAQEPDGLIGISNGIAPTPDGGWYVSSVFTGRIGECDADGAFVRTILIPPEGEVLGAEPFSTGTPNGIGVTADGSLWYADLALAWEFPSR